MKGPGFRYDLDIRRVWVCPACGQRLRYLGHVTSRRCHCDAEGHWMQIVDENLRRTFPKREKIVIPEVYPEEPEEVAAEPVAIDSQGQTVVESNKATETVERPLETDVSPSAPEEPSQSASDSTPQSPKQVSETEENPSRKKRRKKRRRKKYRNKSPEGTESQESSPDSPPPKPPSNEKSQSGPGTEDFGTNVF